MPQTVWPFMSTVFNDFSDDMSSVLQKPQPILSLLPIFFGRRKEAALILDEKLSFEYVGRYSIEHQSVVYELINWYKCIGFPKVLSM